jgi:hypothetical protein
MKEEKKTAIAKNDNDNDEIDIRALYTTVQELKIIVDQNTASQISSDHKFDMVLQLLQELKVSSINLPTSQHSTNNNSTNKDINVEKSTAEPRQPLAADKKAEESILPTHYAYMDDTPFKSPSNPFTARRSSLFSVSHTDPGYPTTILNTPPFSATLDKLNLYDVTHFLDKVNVYQARYHIAIQMTSHFSATAQVAIINSQRWTDEDWWSASNGQIIKALQTYIRPRDDVTFRKILKDTVKLKISGNFRDNDDALLNFEYLYEAINQYQYWFKRAYDFLELFNERLQEIHDNYQRSKQVVGFLTRYEPTNDNSVDNASPRQSSSLSASRDVNEMSYTPNSINELTPHCLHGDNTYDGPSEFHDVNALDPTPRPSPPVDKQTYGCFNMAAFGRCSSAYCKKSHREEDVKAAAIYWYKVLQNSQYNTPINSSEHRN